MAYIMINVDNFENFRTEESVILNSKTRKIQCIRIVSCEKHNGYATVVVNYKMDCNASTEFYTQTAKNLDLSYTKRFQTIIDSRELWQKAEVQLEAA